MTRSLLSSFKPALQIQLLLSTLFKLQRELEEIDQAHIKQLIKSTPSPWQEDFGTLSQLEIQVEHLLKTSQEPLLLELAKTVERGIESCGKSLKSLEWSQSLFRQAAEFLHSCEPNENLYFFLLRHQDDCKKAFGRMFLLNFFKKKHQGLKQTEQFLIDKYQERGFSHLKLSIRTHFTGLTR